MNLMLINRSSARMPRRFIEDWLKPLPRLMPTQRDRQRLQQLEVTVVFLDPAEARALNKRHRGRDYATDVLSFSPIEPGSLGELVLCPEVVRRQAVEVGVSFRQELGLLLVHGALHLLGYDHENVPPSVARRMLRLQGQLIEKLLKGWQN